MKLPVGEEFNQLEQIAALAIYEGKLENRDEFLNTLRESPSVQRMIQMFEADKDYAAFFATAYYGGFYAGLEIEHAAHTQGEDLGALSQAQNLSN